MRRGFRLGRANYHRGHRPFGPHDVLSAEDECYEELAVIADHFASLANLGGQGRTARTVTAPPAAAATRRETRSRGQRRPRRWHR
jgi:hypothetical protein